LRVCEPVVWAGSVAAGVVLANLAAQSEQVVDDADQEQSGGEDVEDAHAGATEVELVGTERAEEEPPQVGGLDGLGAVRVSGHSGGGVDDVDGRLVVGHGETFLFDDGLPWPDPDCERGCTPDRGGPKRLSVDSPWCEQAPVSTGRGEAITRPVGARPCTLGRV